jgi:hypothetical protein
MSAAARVCTTVTGLPSSPSSQASVGSSKTRVRTSACSLSSSSHSEGRAFITTSVRLMALPSSLTDDCLLASTWNYDGTTRHATLRRRTPTMNFQHLRRQTQLYGSRNKSQAPLSPHTVTRLPDNLARTFQPLYTSKCSIHHLLPVISSTSPHASTPTQQSPKRSNAGNSNMAVFFPSGHASAHALRSGRMSEAAVWGANGLGSS